MKCTVLFYSALALIWIKYARALQVDYMDSFKTRIDLNDPSWGYFSSGILKSHSGMAYSRNKSKTLTVAAPAGYSISVAVRLLDLRPSKQDNLTLFAINGGVTPVTYANSASYSRRRFYPREDELLYYVPNGQLGITFTTGPSFFTAGYEGFELIYTVQASMFQCQYRDFHCNNGRCIASILKCDGHNHCADRSSETNCYPYVPATGRTVGIGFGVIFVFIAIACGVFIIIRRAKRSATDTQAIISTHPPPPTNLPSYPPPGTYYPPPPPPYSQGVTNATYH